MSWLGDFFSGCTVAGSFTTVTTTGAPTALTGTAGSVCVIAYKFDPAAATGLTCSTAGITLATNCLGATGLNTFAVNTNSDPTFYSCGKEFALILQGGTVGGTCVSGYTVGTFSLNNRSALRPKIHGRTLSITSAGASCVNSVILRNQALSCFSFLMTDSTNHNPLTTATVTATISKDGSSFNATTNDPSHLANGIYLIDFSNEEMNACIICLRFTATSADDLFITIAPDVG